MSDDRKWRLYNNAPKVALKIVSALTKAYSVVIYYL
jgi:hypothetical protein